MRDSRFVAGVAAGLMLGAGVAAAQAPAAPASAAAPTFARDVAPIVFEHCASCHRPGRHRHDDNSYRNRYNPAPQKEVYWGEQSWDEMFEGWIEYSIDSQDLTAAGTTEGQEE